MQAEATTRAAALAARQHADETEKRINQLSDTLFRTATRATNAAEDGLERARQRIEKASSLIDQMKDESEPSSSVDDLILEPERRATIDELVLRKHRAQTPRAEPKSARAAVCSPRSVASASAEADGFGWVR